MKRTVLDAERGGHGTGCVWGVKHVLVHGRRGMVSEHAGQVWRNVPQVAPAPR